MIGSRLYGGMAHMVACDCMYVLYLTVCVMSCESAFHLLHAIF